MPYKKTTITVQWKRLEWDLEAKPYIQREVIDLVPVTYCLPQKEALRAFKKDGSSSIGEVISIKEVTCFTLWDKIKNWCNKKI